MNLRRHLTALLLLVAMTLLPACATDTPLPASTATRVKLFIDSDGFYRVSGAELARAGALTAQIDPASLQLYRQEKQVPIRVSGAGDSLVIDFFGSTSAAPDSPLTAYALRWNVEPGLRIGDAASDLPAGASSPAAAAPAISFTQTYTEAHPSLYVP